MADRQDAIRELPKRNPVFQMLGVMDAILLSSNAESTQGCRTFVSDYPHEIG